MEDERNPYENACLQRGKEYYEYNNYEPNWKLTDGFEISVRLGKGKYSDVFEGMDTVKNEKVAIKVLKAVRKSKIMREIKILEAIKGGHNVVNLIQPCFDKRTNTIALIFEYVDKQNFKSKVKNLNDHEVRFYLYQILMALDYCHSKGIVHRDVKPMNIIVDSKTNTLKLIDWGLSEFYLPGQEYNVRVASRPFKGPELLVDYKRYGYSLDIWSTGCILGSMIFRMDHLFLGKDNVDQLYAIAKILGTKSLYKYAKKFDINMTKKFKHMKSKSKKPWTSFINSRNAELCNEDVFDLLDKMLTYDHEDRITAKQAMRHPFFDPVRDLFD